MIRKDRKHSMYFSKRSVFNSILREKVIKLKESDTNGMEADILIDRIVDCLLDIYGLSLKDDATVRGRISLKGMIPPEQTR